MNALPLWLILAPLFCALLAALTDRASWRVRKTLAIGGAVVAAGLALTAAWSVHQHGTLHTTSGGWAEPWGIGLSVDAFSVVFVLIFGLGFAASLVFTTSVRKLVKGEAPLLFLLATSANGMIAAADLFNLFVFVELASVCTTALIALKRQRENVAAGFQYSIYAALSGMVFLLVVLLIYSATGQLNMVRIAENIHRLAPRQYGVALAGIIVAFGVKIGLVPLHFWQARAYAAAGSALSGLLSGIMMKVYLCALLRVLWLPFAIRQHSVSLPGLLIVLGAVNILGGHLMALAQRDLKRLLAFSSVAHLGYILMGMGAGVEVGLAAALYHSVSHALMKSALFWSGCAFIARAGSADERRFHGVAKAEPLAFAVFFIAALAIIGVPPSGGFASKWLISLATIAHHGVWPVAVIALGTLISLVYYGRIFYWTLKPNTTVETQSRRAKLGENGVLMLGAAGCLAAGLGIRWLWPWLCTAAAALEGSRF